MRDEEEHITINADDIRPAVDANGNVVIEFGFSRLPVGKDRFRLTLALPADTAEAFASSLRGKAAEARAAKIRH